MLTIEQKIEAYKWVKSKKHNPMYYICNQLYFWLIENGYKDGCHWEEYFPEWLQKKPDDILEEDEAWWEDGSPLRLQALDEVIEELEKQLKEKI